MAVGLRIMRPSLTSLRMFCREFALPISAVSFGSSQTFLLPHFSTEEANRFCSRRLLEGGRWALNRVDIPIKAHSTGKYTVQTILSTLHPTQCYIETENGAYCTETLGPRDPIQGFTLLQQLYNHNTTVRHILANRAKYLLNL